MLRQVAGITTRTKIDYTKSISRSHYCFRASSSGGIISGTGSTDSSGSNSGDAVTRTNRSSNIAFRPPLLGNNKLLPSQLAPGLSSRNDYYCGLNVLTRSLPLTFSPLISPPKKLNERHVAANSASSDLSLPYAELRTRTARGTSDSWRGGDLNRLCSIHNSSSFSLQYGNTLTQLRLFQSLRQVKQRRQINSSSSNGTNKSGKEQIETPTNKISNSNSSSSNSGSGSVTDRARKTLTSMEWHLSDFVTVVSIFSLLTGIVLGPLALETYKRSNADYEDLVDDEITNLTKVMNDYYESKPGEEGGDNGNGKKDLIADSASEIVTQILKNEQLQSTLIQMVVKVLQSPEVLAASQVLVKQLFADLLNDPDTIQQVVELVQKVVQNEVTKKAVSELIVLLVADDDVYKAFTKMVVKIGEEKEVVQATQALLTESTHKTLADPDILDHSMEFAADVVGDDVVQRTSGEALWNTINYSVRPAVTTLLYVSGVSLVVFTFAALGKSLSNQSNAAAVSNGDLLLPSSLTDETIQKLLTYPTSLLSHFSSGIIAVITLPLKLPHLILAGLSSSNKAIHRFYQNIKATPQTIYNKYNKILSFLTQSLPQLLSTTVFTKIDFTKEYMHNYILLFQENKIVGNILAVEKTIIHSFKRVYGCVYGICCTVGSFTVNSFAVLRDMIHGLAAGNFHPSNIITVIWEKCHNGGKTISTKARNALDRSDGVIYRLYFVIVSACGNVSVSNIGQGCSRLLNSLWTCLFFTSSGGNSNSGE